MNSDPNALFNPYPESKDKAHPVPKVSFDITLEDRNLLKYVHLSPGTQQATIAQLVRAFCDALRANGATYHSSDNRDIYRKLLSECTTYISNWRRPVADGRTGVETFSRSDTTKAANLIGNASGAGKGKRAK